MYRVLVADDEPIERRVVSKTIQRYFPGQIEVIQAVNGREAVELFEKRGCQIALLDIEMPGINGLEAAERIRKYDKDCSIIFLTAFDEFNYAKKAITVRALDYLLKPSADEELVTVLEEAIRIAGEHRQGTQGVLDSSNGELQPGSPVDGENFENVRLNAVTESIREYISVHYSEDLSLQDVAGSFHYSDAYFCKIFKQCFDRSFTVYLAEYRIEKAKHLLADVAINIKDISTEVGYRDSSYFTKVFRRVEGITPTEYRMHVLGVEKQG